MKKGGVGGGNTTTGIDFEVKVDFLTALDKIPGYDIRKATVGFEVLFNDKVVAHSYKQHDFYKFLESEGVEWQKIVSKKLLPDDAIYVIKENTLYILEVKYQQVQGSVDEKLQTCDFKRKQYKKLMSHLNREVEYIYILSKWFQDPKYKDVLDYVISVGCQYYFEYLPLHKIGLPVPQAD